MDSGFEAGLRSLDETRHPELPDYLVKTYWWAYLRPASVLLFDNPVFLTALLWGNLPRLVRAACEEFSAGDRLMQAANAYGPLSVELASTVGPSGALEVIDIAPLQVDLVNRKLAGQPHAFARVADAAHPGTGIYDGICCFFLLHEIPDDRKVQVVDALLQRVRPGGKVVFIDYHRARPWHPLRTPMELMFRVLEPFAHGLITREIRDLASHGAGFTWRKETYFGGLYQKVVAVRADGPAAPALS